jgi:hypothetical protein
VFYPRSSGAAARGEDSAAAAAADCDAVLSLVAGALEVRALSAAFHMHFVSSESVVPGVMLQGLFETPRPLVPRFVRWLTGDVSVHELKFVVIWGRAILAHTRSVPSLKTVILPDGRGEANANAPVAWLFARHGARLAALAERIAHAIGDPSLRVDFFVAPGGRWALNEIEIMQGEVYDEPDALEQCMGALWRAPYAAKQLSVVRRSDDDIAADIRHATAGPHDAIHG